jgi:hypothetical protein
MLIAASLVGCNAVGDGSNSYPPTSKRYMFESYVSRLDEIQEGDTLNGIFRKEQVDPLMIETMFGPGEHNQRFASVTLFKSYEKTSWRTFLYSPRVHFTPYQMQSLLTSSNKSDVIPKLVVEKILE